jgi:hypothetical protein
MMRSNKKLNKKMHIQLYKIKGKEFKGKMKKS